MLLVSKKNQSGSSLIEVLVAIAVVGVVLTAIAFSLSFSVKNSAQAEYRQIGSRYAQQAMEIIREQRSLLVWGAFVTALPESTDYRCFSLDRTNFEEPFENAGSNLLEITNCTLVHTEPRTDFQRVFRVIESTPEMVDIEVVVTWRDGEEVRSTNVRQRFQNI